MILHALDLRLNWGFFCYLDSCANLHLHPELPLPFGKPFWLSLQTLQGLGIQSHSLPKWLQWLITLVIKTVLLYL